MILDEPSYAQIKPIFISLSDYSMLPQGLPSIRYLCFTAESPSRRRRLDITEMSGCPIFGSAHEPKGGASYYFVAIQSGWLPDSKVAYACQMPFLGKASTDGGAQHRG